MFTEEDNTDNYNYSKKKTEIRLKNCKYNKTTKKKRTSENIQILPYFKLKPIENVGHLNVKNLLEHYTLCK